VEEGAALKKCMDDQLAEEAAESLADSIESCLAEEQDQEIMSAPVFEVPPSSDEESPVSPCISPKVKRCKKEVAPKPLQNEAGDYLNPKTNRYVKHGTSAFKKLVKEGLLNADCSINDQ
jgi:hypothetical protein